MINGFPACNTNPSLWRASFNFFRSIFHWKPLHTNFSTSSIHQLISRHQRSSQGGAQHNSGDLPEYEENNNEGRFDPEGADVDSRSKSGFVNGMALTVPSLALSLKLNKVEENKGTMADNVEDTKMVEMRIL